MNWKNESIFCCIFFCLRLCFRFAVVFSYLWLRYIICCCVFLFAVVFCCCVLFVCFFCSYVFILWLWMAFKGHRIQEMRLSLFFPASLLCQIACISTVLFEKKFDFIVNVSACVCVCVYFSFLWCVSVLPLPPTWVCFYLDFRGLVCPQRHPAAAPQVTGNIHHLTSHVNSQPTW